MAGPNPLPVVAVDIGNTRTKLGVFEHPFAQPLPHPHRTGSLAPDWTDADMEAIFPHGPTQYEWAIASVNRPSSARLTQWLEQAGVTRVRQLVEEDLPLKVALAHPEKVGMDRLVDAVAANCVREPGVPAILIDMGTALTIDLVNAEGAFAGGAILPGIALSARALHEFTDLLPLVELTEPPPALGHLPVEAIRSGLYWGAVGAARELIAQLVPEGPEPQIFLTGGAGPLFAGVLATESPRQPEFIPHLTLAGIALTAVASAPPKGSS